MNDEPKPRTGGGRPYRSALNPHCARIEALRNEGATWEEVAAALAELGVRIGADGVRQFHVRRLTPRRLRARRTFISGRPEPAPKPQPSARRGPAAAGEPLEGAAAAEFTPKTCRLEMPIPTQPQPPVLFTRPKPTNPK